MLNAGESVVHNRHMSDLQPLDIRRRIRELLAIPDRDRTDEQWDELIELEIRTAPGNRESDFPAERQNDKRPGSNSGRRQNHSPKSNVPRPERPPQEARPVEVRLPKRQHRRPKRPPQATENATNNGNAGNGGNTQNPGGSTGGSEGQS